MNFVQQFLEENLSKDLNHHVLQQIQNSNSAIETLISHFEGLRQKQNENIIQKKINRIQIYLELKNNINMHMKSIQSNNQVFQWLLNAFISNKFLYELVKKQQFFIQKQISQIVKKTLLNQQFEVNVQENQLGKKNIKDLEFFKQQRNEKGKHINRQKLKEIDIILEKFQQKIKMFQRKVQNFNVQMLLLLKKLYAFEEKISNVFYEHFDSKMIKKSKIIEQKPKQQSFIRNYSQKSHYSQSSQQHNSPLNLVSKKSVIQNQLTPRRKLQTTIKPQPYENKRSSIRLVNNYLDERLDINQFRNMNKTLSNFNFYRSPPQDLIYTTSNFGRQVRLPTKWTDKNTRSSISYYPPR